MHHVYVRNKDNKYSTAILIKDSAFNTDNLKHHYIKPSGLPIDSIICFSLKYNNNDKAPVKFIKEYLKDLLCDIKTVGSNTLLVADPAYFKVLTGKRKTEPHHGYIKPCVIKDYEHLSIILVANYQALFHNPVVQEKIDLSITALKNHIKGVHVDIGSNIMHHAEYPSEYKQIKKFLDGLLKYPELTCDIEAFSLKFWEAGIGTIAFSIDKHRGVAFPVDYAENGVLKKNGNKIVYGRQFNNTNIKKLLKEFFLEYKGKLTYHNATYDIKVLIYELFMKYALDYKGLLHGLDVMCRSIDDTKLIAYLATNTTAGNDLSLKSCAFEYAGNYAQDDIKDIRLIPLPELLKYNLTDCLATEYVKEKYTPIMIHDNQLKLYDELFIPQTRLIIHTELTGMPMDMDKVLKLDFKLNSILEFEYFKLSHNQIIKKFEWQMNRLAMIDANYLLKKKIRPMQEFNEKFNTASPKQIAELLHEFWDFEIIETTDGGAPSTGSKVLQKHLDKLMRDYNITDDEL